MTASVPCGHKPMKCGEECANVVKGVAYTYEEPKEIVLERTKNFGQGPYERAEYFGARALDAVDLAKEAVNVGIEANKAAMAKLDNIIPWQEVHQVGSDMEEAGIEANKAAMAKLD